MIYDNLLKYSFEFIKESGLLKVPEKTLREVEEWALSVYFNMMHDYYFLPKLKQLGPSDLKPLEKVDIFSETKPNNYYKRKELIELLIECKRFITKKISPNTTFYIKSPFSDKLFSFGAVFLLEDSPYRKGFWNSEEIKYQNDIENDDIFKLGFLTLLFDAKIDYPYDIDKIEIKANEIKITVRHELQHMMQTLIKCEHGQINSDKVQLGKNIRETNFDNENLTHYHRDVEFYTDLNDSIELFKSIIVKIPLFLHQFYFDSWIAIFSVNSFWQKLESPEVKMFFRKQRITLERKFSFYEKELKQNGSMFESWKLHEPEKYKKAVKEFYKEVEYLL